MFVDTQKSFNRKLTPNRNHPSFSSFCPNRIHFYFSRPDCKQSLHFGVKDYRFSINFAKEN